jgi:hypothetical protein
MVAALSPFEIGLGDMQPTAGGAITGSGWLDGSPAPFVKFPATPVGIGDDEVIDEVPIFHFVFVNDEGKWAAPRYRPCWERARSTRRRRGRSTAPPTFPPRVQRVLARVQRDRPCERPCVRAGGFGRRHGVDGGGRERPGDDDSGT